MLSCVWLFATPWTAARQASLSFTISQNLLKLMSTESVMLSNHLILCHLLLLLPSIFPASGSFPMSWLFPSLLSQSDVKVAQSCLTLCDPMDYTVHGILQARILEWVAFPFSRASSQPKDWTHVFRIAGRFFTHCAIQGKPKDAGVGSLSLLQQIFLTQESNRSLLRCRCILYPYSAKILKLRCIGQDTYTLKFWNKSFKGMIYENTLLVWEYSWRSLNASAWMLTENSVVY